MALVELFALQKDQKAILEQLQRWGVLDIETATLDEETNACPEGFSRRDTGLQVADFEQKVRTLEQALSILNEFAPVKKGLLASFSGRREISEEAFSGAEGQVTEHLDMAAEIIHQNRFIAETKAEIVRIQTAIVQMEPWRALDVPLDFSGTASTKAFIGTVQGQWNEETLLSALAERVPQVDLTAEIISVGREQTCIFALCPNSQTEDLTAALRSLGFARPTQNAAKTPGEEIAWYKKRIESLESDIEASKQKILSFAKARPALELTIDFLLASAEKYRTMGTLPQTRHTIFIRGYLPERQVPLLKKRLSEKFDISLESTPADESLAPVKLSNNAFHYPAETITEMYALPSAQDIDPTPITSFFYYLFFGIMLADAGYGLLLVFGSWFLIKKFKPEPAMRRNLLLFLYCGVSTTIWGLLFGSFFGDAIAVISENFFGKAIRLPAILDPMNGDAVQFLILSILLGFVQVIVGLCTKMYVLWRNGDKFAALCDAGLWVTTLLGIAVFALGMVAVPALKQFGAILAVVSVVGLILTQGRHSKGIMKLISGIGSLYDITGYVSDLLSFSRLMALGLTSAAMGSVFNLLGTMAGKGVAGILVLLLIFPVGHAINFGLNALGAYVHTLRLQYVELFSKFYEGGGRVFRPFAFHSKYVRIKEENQK